MSDKEKVASRYDKWTFFYDAVDNFPIVGSPQKRWKENAIDALELKGNEIVLDIGTASGRIIPKITSKIDGGKVFGTDISKGMIRKADRRLKKEGIHDTARVIYDDIENSRFPDNYFDRIIATFTFTTLPNPKKAALECARILKPSGKMIVLDTGKPASRLALLFFYPMMLSAKLFGRTHMDRDISAILNNYFETEKISSNMLGMVYTLECKNNKEK